MVNEANEAIVSDKIEVNVISEIFAADKSIVIDKVAAVNEANVAVDEDNGLLDNQLAELEKLDEADKVV